MARSNVELQAQSLAIVESRFRYGAVTELDVAQSRSLLRDTESSIFAFEASIRQSQNTLCILLGIPPRDLTEMLGETASIPAAPEEIVIGIPAELLRRRPDVRRAERDIASQSAQIGIAASDLYPRLTLVGSLGFQAEDFVDLFDGKSFTAFGGPSFRWNILNYGRIRNNIRVQDAIYQQLIVAYEDTVLRAQQEVEDSVASYVSSVSQVEVLGEAVDAARRAVELADLQYREGAVDYNRVLNVQQSRPTSARVVLGPPRNSAGAVFGRKGEGHQRRRVIHASYRQHDELPAAQVIHLKDRESALFCMLELERPIL